MNLYVYSDESGVFDKKNNKIFAYGGLILFSSDDHEKWKRKYLAAERSIRKSEQLIRELEVKATNISNKSKSKLYRSLNQTSKFGTIVNQEQVLDNIYENKKTKQRYLDYAYKIGVKRKFQDLIKKKVINPADVDNIYFYVDEHTTATNGLYELQEGLEQEFKFGTNNWNYSKYFSPIFPDVNSVSVSYCNSQKKTLIRAADIIANQMLYSAKNKKINNVKQNKLTVTYLP